MKNFFSNFPKAAGLFALFGLAFILCMLWLAPAPPSDAYTGASNQFFHICTLTDTNADKTASFNSTAFDTENSKYVLVDWDCTEDSGTATLDGTVQHSVDGTNWFNTSTTFTQLSATGTEEEAILTGQFHRYVRVAVTVTGTGQWDVDFYWTAKSGQP